MLYLDQVCILSSIQFMSQTFLTEFKFCIMAKLNAEIVSSEIKLCNCGQSDQIWRISPLQRNIKNFFHFLKRLCLVLDKILKTTTMQKNVRFWKIFIIANGHILNKLSSHLVTQSMVHFNCSYDKGDSNPSLQVCGFESQPLNG